MNTLKKCIQFDGGVIMDAEIYAYREMMMKEKEEVPIWERKWLTIEEAAAYSGIGRSKLRELANENGCPFAIWMGNKIHIIKDKLDKYTEMESRL